MSFKLFALSIALFSVAASAFPSYAKRGLVSSPGQASRRVLQRAAAPYLPQYNYTGAKLDGGPGTGIGGVHVPAPGDTEHYFQDPPPGAQRGPCPGLNTLANHGFISRDGITTYTELVAALQNVYNVEWSAAVILTVLGIGFDGDPITEKLSIGGDATFQTGQTGEFTGYYGGLSRHGTFELDGSLTRDDFYLHGDSHTFNATRFKMMTDTVATTSSKENPLFNFEGIALYRSQIYETSVATNPYFYFPNLILHNYGASTFLFNTFPSSSRNNTPDLPTIASFFGAVPLQNGEFGSQPERIPANWTNQVNALTVADIVTGINQLYGSYPKDIGGNYGLGNWISLDGGNATSGPPAPPPSNSTASNSTSSSSNALSICGVASEFTTIVGLAPDPIAMAVFVIEKLSPVFDPLGCNITTIIEGEL